MSSASPDHAPRWMDRFLGRAGRNHRVVPQDGVPLLAEALAAARTSRGESLAAMSERAPVLLIFLRSFG